MPSAVLAIIVDNPGDVSSLKMWLDIALRRHLHGEIRADDLRPAYRKLHNDAPFHLVDVEFGCWQTESLFRAVKVSPLLSSYVGLSSLPDIEAKILPAWNDPPKVPGWLAEHRDIRRWIGETDPA